MTLPATRWRVRQRPQVVRHTTADRAFEQFDHVIECTGRDAEFGVTTKIWGIWAFACLRTPRTLLYFQHPGAGHGRRYIEGIQTGRRTMAAIPSGACQFFGAK